MVTRRDDREHHPAAEPVGQRTDRDAAEGADDDRDRDEQGDVGLAEGRRGCPWSGRAGPSGLISAQAQKFTANPRVAMRQHQPRRGALVGHWAALR